jgi:hypothetical protein
LKPPPTLLGSRKKKRAVLYMALDARGDVKRALRALKA